MILKWLKNWITLTPFYIGGKENPYMLRWFILPRNPWFNCYMHKFLRDDDDRALHDHPWWFVSVMVSGQYIEWREQATVWGGCDFPFFELSGHVRRA